MHAAADLDQMAQTPSAYHAPAGVVTPDQISNNLKSRLETPRVEAFKNQYNEAADPPLEIESLPTQPPFIPLSEAKPVGIPFTACVDGVTLRGDLTGSRTRFDAALLPEAVARTLAAFPKTQGHAFSGASSADRGRLEEGVRAVLRLPPAESVRLNYVAVEGRTCPQPSPALRP